MALRSCVPPAPLGDVHPRGRQQVSGSGRSKSSSDTANPSFSNAISTSVNEEQGRGVSSRGRSAAGNSRHRSSPPLPTGAVAHVKHSQLFPVPEPAQVALGRAGPSSPWPGELLPAALSTDGLSSGLLSPFPDGNCVKERHNRGQAGAGCSSAGLEPRSPPAEQGQRPRLTQTPLEQPRSAL